MKYLLFSARAVLNAALVFSFSDIHAQPRHQDTSVLEMNFFMKLDTIVFLENQVFENVVHSLRISSNSDEMLVFNYFPISRIDTFYLIVMNKESRSIHYQKIAIPENEYLHLKRFNHCSGAVINDSNVILSFFNKFIVFTRKENGQLNFSHSLGHDYGFFSELSLDDDTLLAAKCDYSSSSKSTVLLKFNVGKGIMTEAGSWAHPYIEFATFDMNKKWICFSNKRLFVSNAFDDTILVIHNNKEVSKFSLKLDFQNPDYKLDSLRGIISESEPGKWIDVLSDAYYFKSSLINFIEIIDSQYLLIRYVRPGESYDNRSYFACAKLNQDMSGIEEYVFKEIQEFRVPKNVNQFISRENFDFTSTSALLDMHNRDCVLVKAAGKTQKYNDTRANLFSLNQTYLKNYDPLICLYFYTFTFRER